MRGALGGLLPASALVLITTVIAFPPCSFRPACPRCRRRRGVRGPVRVAISTSPCRRRTTCSPSWTIADPPLLVAQRGGTVYLFWPAIVLLVVRLGRGRSSIGRWIGPVAGLVVLASFGFSLWLTEVNAPWAFFSLLTRAWELGLGALLAVGATYLARIPATGGATPAWVGLALIGSSAVILDTATPFPGAAALPLDGGRGARDRRRVPAERAGSWPVACAARPALLRTDLVLVVLCGTGPSSSSLRRWSMVDFPGWVRLALVGAAIACAWATERWVERPFRHGQWVGLLPRRTLVMAGMLTLVVTTVSLGSG